MYRNTLHSLAAASLLLTLVACNAEQEQQRRGASVIDARVVEEPTPASTPASEQAHALTKAAASGDMLPVSPTPADAEAVVRDYYAAIDEGDFARAYAHWSDDGAASGQDLQGFSQGYAKTESVTAKVGKATAEEAAAGSRYILVPVELHSQLNDGSKRAYRGFFTLRAVMADGATAAQRQWHLAAAELERLAD